MSIAYHIEQIRAPIEALSKQAEEHSNTLTKPPGSLGKLEQLAKQLAAMTGQLWPSLDKRAVIVMAADHGVCEEGISAFPQSVTPQMVQNFLNGGAAINVLAKQANASVVCVDIGVAVPIEHPNLISKKIMSGTHNMTKQAAMSEEQALAAIQVGIDIVEEQVANGITMFATGEMGIGNTTASAAIVSVLTGLSAEEVVGRGTGIKDDMLLHKVNIVKTAISKHCLSKESSALDVLSHVGGLEIAGLVGVIIGAAKHRCPVVIDGYISTAAALIAVKLSEKVIPYMIASHQSQEQGHTHALAAMGLSPMIQLDFRVGEGTGAVLCFHFIDAALLLMQEMATFESAGVDGRSEE